MKSKMRKQIKGLEKKRTGRKSILSPSLGIWYAIFQSSIFYRPCTVPAKNPVRTTGLECNAVQCDCRVFVMFALM